MTTNHDALREALAFAQEARTHCYHFDCISPTRLVYKLQAALSQPMPEAAQGWIPVDRQMPKSGQIVLALQKWDHSGKLGVIRAAWIAAKTEESSPESDIGEYDEETDTYYDPEGWYEQISHWDELSAVGVSGATIVAWMPPPDVLSASPAAPQQQDQDIEQLIRERDQRDEIIDRLCDAVLGSERPEWSSAYGFDDAVADVEGRITQLHQPSVDRAWARFEQASAQPQAQGEPLILETAAEAKADREYAEKYYRQAERLLTSNEQTLHAENSRLRESLAQHRAALEKCVWALEFYAGGSHFTMHDPDAWDTVSGEPQNFYEDENNTATVEDGSIAKAAITEAERVLKGGGE